MLNDGLCLVLKCELHLHPVSSRLSQARQICESKELLLKEKVRAARKRAEAAAAAGVREERMKTLRKELKDVGNMVMQMSDDVNPKELHALLQQVQQRQEDIQQELAVLVMQVSFQNHSKSHRKLRCF